MLVCFERNRLFLSEIYRFERNRPRCEQNFSKTVKFAQKHTCILPTRRGNPPSVYVRARQLRHKSQSSYTCLMFILSTQCNILNMLALISQCICIIWNTNILFMIVLIILASGYGLGLCGYGLGLCG